MPVFTWKELENALEDLAATPAQKDRVGPFLEGVKRKEGELDSADLLSMILATAYLTLMEDPGSEIAAALLAFPGH